MPTFPYPEPAIPVVRQHRGINAHFRPANGLCLSCKAPTRGAGDAARRLHVRAAARGARGCQPA